jgi:hypothetical protein
MRPTVKLFIKLVSIREISDYDCPCVAFLHLELSRGPPFLKYKCLVIQHFCRKIGQRMMCRKSNLSGDVIRENQLPVTLSLVGSNLLFFGFLFLQFIVVSLKEGMFNNANVLFRTKFVDGVSTVQRTVAAKQSK